MSTTLILMAGMPGAGKSTIAAALGQSLGWPVIDKDVIATALLDAGLPEVVMQPAAYDTCFGLTRDLLVRQQRSTILDTPCGYPIVLERAKALCHDANADLIAVLCSADRDVRNHRVARRKALRSQPVGHSRTLGYARERFAHLPADYIEVITDGGSFEDSIRYAIEAVRRRIG